jgi:hypothetical protein
VQKTTITVNKTKQSHTETPKFSWFPQCEVRPQGEAITKKFTIKDETQNSKEKILRNQSSNTRKSHLQQLQGQVYLGWHCGKDEALVGQLENDVFVKRRQGHPY